VAVKQRNIGNHQAQREKERKTAKVLIPSCCPEGRREEGRGREKGRTTDCGGGMKMKRNNRAQHQKPEYVAIVVWQQWKRKRHMKNDVWHQNEYGKTVTCAAWRPGSGSGSSKRKITSAYQISENVSEYRKEGKDNGMAVATKRWKKKYRDRRRKNNAKSMKEQSNMTTI